ncbi:MAG: hypothetical protein IRY89_14025 [Pseudolabrys sp.]|nr:hypothetical protein [Pseudolabrys sp.]
MMGHSFDRLTCLPHAADAFDAGRGTVSPADQLWKENYHKRLRHGEIMSSAHGTNCAGPRWWKIWVEGRIATREIQ